MFRALVLVVAAATVGLVAVGLVGGQHSAEAQQTASATRIPDANIIIMLRDPVERAYSHYSLLAIYGHDRKPFYQALLDDQARHGKLLGQARLYVEQGLYFDGIKRYLDTFGSRKVRIYLTEDFSADSAKMLEDVCEFLALPFSNGDFFDPHRNYNYSRPPRNAAIRWVKSSRLLRS